MPAGPAERTVSRRRHGIAEGATAALTREGVDASSIAVVGKGETYGDRLKLFEDDQQDRSVKITLTK